MSLTYNPAQVTNAANTFYATSDGAMQGFYNDNPTTRQRLMSGIVAPSQSTNLWGGCAITASLPNIGGSLGNVNGYVSGAIQATAVANITGWTVWNQSLATVLNPSVTNPIPLAAAGNGTNPGGAINFFMTGSGAQIWVQCSSTVASTLKGGSFLQTVYWDYTNQVLLTSGTGALPVKVVDVVTNGNAMVVATGGSSWNYAGYAALIEI